MLTEKPTQTERSRRRSELLEAGPVRRYMLRETRGAHIGRYSRHPSDSEPPHEPEKRHDRLGVHR